MNDDQILLLTREITGIGTKQDAMMEMMREMKVEMVSKAEMKALKEAHEREMNDLREDFKDLLEEVETDKKNRKEAPHRLVTYVLMILAAVPGIVALFQHH